jgi:hypothetical protein
VWSAAPNEGMASIAGNTGSGTYFVDGSEAIDGKSLT